MKTKLFSRALSLMLLSAIACGEPAWRCLLAFSVCSRRHASGVSYLRYHANRKGTADAVPFLLP